MPQSRLVDFRPGPRLAGKLGNPPQRNFQAFQCLGFGFRLGHDFSFSATQAAALVLGQAMVLFPAVIVHGIEDARAALAPGRPLIFLSAPGAALHGGCLWWQALMRLAGQNFSLLDCGDAPGRAVEALRLGLPGVVLACEDTAFAVVAGIAAAEGVLLLPAAPPALDMAAPGAARRLAAWLG
jgi:hypothetical protein